MTPVYWYGFCGHRHADPTEMHACAACTRAHRMWCNDCDWCAAVTAPETKNAPSRV